MFEAAPYDNLSICQVCAYTAFPTPSAHLIYVLKGVHYLQRGAKRQLQRHRVRIIFQDASPISNVRFQKRCRRRYAN